MNNPIELQDAIERVARALHAHEWAGQPKPDNFGTDREYWMSAARAAIAALSSQTPLEGDDG